MLPKGSNGTRSAATAAGAALVLLVAFQGELRAEDPATATQAAATTPAPSNGTPVPLTKKEKFVFYLKSTYGPSSIMRSAAGAGLSQARDSTPEWGQGMEGYGRRLGSKFAQHAVKRTIQLGVGAMLHEDPRYYASGRVGFLPRTGYAVSRAFMVRKDDGSTGPAIGRLTGAFGGALISRTWHPESDRTVRSGLESGAVSIGVDMGFQVLHEFWPDIKRLFRR